MLYQIEITSILGPKGKIVDLPNSVQTEQRLKKGIIVTAEQYKPTEKKRTVRKSKAE